MAKTRTTRGRQPQAPRPVRSPSSKPSPRRYRRYLWPAAIVVAAVVVFLVAKNQAQGPGEAVTPPARGLPDTPDYHSLLVAPDDPNRLWLGTHVGLYESTDGGASWRFAALEGRDSMNLARTSDTEVWTAGHNVLARSDDGAATWENVDPVGLPSLDIHGFGRDPRDPATLYAAVAGEGLYRSENGGQSFQLVSSEVGGSVFGLAVLDDGGILAGDLERGILASRDDGKSWELAERFGAAGIAVNPSDSNTILAGGQGAFGGGLILTTDGGATWQPVLNIEQGAGPVAWALSDPRVGYAVGFDERLYKTTDTGASWQPVAS